MVLFALGTGGGGGRIGGLVSVNFVVGAVGFIETGGRALPWVSSTLFGTASVLSDVRSLLLADPES